MSNYMMYRIKLLFFGISCGSSLFCNIIVKILQDQIKLRRVIVFIDDILLMSKSYRKNLELIEEIFKVLIQYMIKLSLKKCQLAKQEVEFLGFRLSSKGYSPIPERVDAIKRLKVSKNKKEVMQVLGVLNSSQFFYITLLIM